MASAYRIVSAKALQVITGTMPIDLLVEERRILFKTGQGHVEKNPGYGLNANTIALAIVQPKC